MNELIDKIIERLEEKQMDSSSGFAETTIGMCGASASEYRGEMHAYINAITIVKELAEEYNNGWIPVEERLPVDGRTHEVTVEFCERRFIEYGYYDLFREEWREASDNGLLNVVAWKEHSAPYQPKGE